jgi:uncharacterized membrane protein
MIASVEFYDIVKWLHITGVVVGFGSTFAYGIFIVTAMKTHPKSVPGVLAGISETSRTIVTGGAVLALITGIYMAADIDQMSEFYVAWGFVAILVLLGLTHAFFRPNEIAARKAAERDVDAAGDGPVQWSPEYEAASGKLSKMGPVAGIIIVLTIYVMTAKPFL